MKRKIMLILIIVTLFCSCSEKKDTAIDNITEGKDVELVTEKPTISTEVTVVPEEIVIRCCVVPVAYKPIYELSNLYAQEYSNVSFDIYVDSTDFCINSYKKGESDIIFIIDEHECDKASADSNINNMCRAGLVIVVNKNNDVTDLSSKQVIQIFENDINYWSDIGGNKEEIELYSVNSNVMNLLIEVFNINYEIVSFDEISHVYMYEPELALEKYPNGITGVLVGELSKNMNIKELSIDGITPSCENIKSGEYKYYYDIFTITDKEANKDIKTFINFCTTDEEALEYLESAGYLIP